MQYWRNSDVTVAPKGRSGIKVGHFWRAGGVTVRDGGIIALQWQNSGITTAQGAMLAIFLQQCFCNVFLLQFFNDRGKCCPFSCKIFFWKCLHLSIFQSTTQDEMCPFFTLEVGSETPFWQLPRILWGGRRNPIRRLGHLMTTFRVNGLHVFAWTE